MNKEDYVSLEVAKLLKEKGYNEYCAAYYHLNWENMTEEECFEVAPNHDFRNKDNGYRVGAPTLYEAQKWLRNKYNIHIIVETDYNNMYSLKCSNSQDCEMCIELDRLPKEDSEIYIYKSYEEALNEGILEALKLI